MELHPSKLTRIFEEDPSCGFPTSDDNTLYICKHALSPQTLGQMCPGSLKLTLRALQRGAQLQLGQCLQMEYRVACRATENHDFPEGNCLHGLFL